MECAVCRGRSVWEVTPENGQTQHACTHHVSMVLSNIGRGILILVRGL